MHTYALINAPYQNYTFSKHFIIDIIFNIKWQHIIQIYSLIWC